MKKATMEPSIGQHFLTCFHGDNILGTIVMVVALVVDITHSRIPKVFNLQLKFLEALLREELANAIDQL